MITTFTIKYNGTSDINVGMEPVVVMSQTYQIQDGSHILIWEPPSVAGADKYKAALQKQKDKRRLKSV